jgi:hypothetical protein
VGSFAEFKERQWRRQLHKTRQAVMRWYFHGEGTGFVFPALVDDEALARLRDDLAAALARYPLEVVARDWKPFARIEVRRMEL